jgi:hypothetical protein
MFIARLWRTNTGCPNYSLLGDSTLINIDCMARKVLRYLYTAAA